MVCTFYLLDIDRGRACLSNVAKCPILRQLLPSHGFVISEMGK